MTGGAGPNEDGGRALDAARAATRAAHARLDRRLRLVGPGLTRARYAAYLRELAPMIEAADGLLAEPLRDDGAGVAGLLPDAPARRKADAVHADLAELEVVGTYAPALLPAADDAASRFGVLYVFEGATLGGAVLARRLEVALGPVPSRYLRCYGEQARPMWAAFCDAMERAAPGVAARERLARAALASFEMVERRLARGGLLAPPFPEGP